MSITVIVAAFFGVTCLLSHTTDSSAANNGAAKDGAQIVADDRHLVLYASGVVFDTKSGFEWYLGPDRGLNWEEAHQWVQALTAAGGGWRMPTRREAKTLHTIGDGINNMTHLLYNTGYWIWTGSDSASAARWLFSFSYGGEGWHGEAPPDGGRALAVRFRGPP